MSQSFRDQSYDGLIMRKQKLRTIVVHVSIFPFTSNTTLTVCKIFFVLLKYFTSSELDCTTCELSAEICGEI